MTKSKNSPICDCGNRASRRVGDGLCGKCRPQPAVMLVPAQDYECDCQEHHGALMGMVGGCLCNCHLSGLVEVCAPEVDLHGTAIIERLAAVRCAV